VSRSTGRCPFVNRRSLPTSYAAVAYCLSVCLPVALDDFPSSGRRSDPPLFRHQDTTGSGQPFVVSKRRVRHADGSLTFVHSLATLRQYHSRQRFILNGGQGRNRTGDTRIFSPGIKNQLSPQNSYGYWRGSVQYLGEIRAFRTLIPRDSTT
jgi:hypothetical protein